MVSVTNLQILQEQSHDTLNKFEACVGDVGEILGSHGGV